MIRRRRTACRELGPAHAARPGDVEIRCNLQMHMQHTYLCAAIVRLKGVRMHPWAEDDAASRGRYNSTADRGACGPAEADRQHTCHARLNLLTSNDPGRFFPA